MSQVLAIAVGGAIGAVMRYWTSVTVHTALGRGFPYGTLTVNVIGSLLMGYLFVLFTERLGVGSHWRAGLLVGVLGAFTTFSTFSIETVNLMEEGAYVRAISNIVVSVIVCVSAAWLGVLLGRQT
ncbi:MAG: fluoride efflux transporter CrcB [Gammaproteobacteria bacterium]|nr:MAG: fluoride efflux transporter CrcB [Gammaproteobacteria bacterium]